MKHTMMLSILTMIFMFKGFSFEGDYMKLVNSKTGFVIAEVSENKCQFHDPIMEQELTNEGIFIPQFLRSEFNGKKHVFPGDPLFAKAFVTVYYEFTIKNKQLFVIETN